MKGKVTRHNFYSDSYSRTMKRKIKQISSDGLLSSNFNKRTTSLIKSLNTKIP
jgi:hypothetical protein